MQFPNFSSFITTPLAALVVALFALTAHAGDIPELDWEPQAGWIDVTDFGADPTDIDDDYVAIQTAFYSVTDDCQTIYFPPGTYLLSKRLLLDRSDKPRLHLLGHGKTTIIKWNEAPELDSDNDEMIRVGSNGYAHYTGLTLDGNGKAEIGFRHYSAHFETGVRYRHMSFKNLNGAAVYATREHVNPMSLAEPVFENCKFENCGTGIATSSQNDYNFVINGCDFINCNYGIYNFKGSFYVRDSYFEGNMTDISSSLGHGDTIRRCVSKGSDRFVYLTAPTIPVRIEDCFIKDWGATDGAIYFNRSSLFVANCRFEKTPVSDTQNPIVVGSWGYAKLFLCNNEAPGWSQVYSANTSNTSIYQVPAGSEPKQVAVSTSSSITSFLNETVDVSGIVHNVIDYYTTPSTTDTEAIQACIDAASAEGNGAIAYFPIDSYIVTDTIDVSGSNFTISGTGFLGSKFIWSGSSTDDLMHVHNVSNVTIEHLSLKSSFGTNEADLRITSDSWFATDLIIDGVEAYGSFKGEADQQGMVLDSLGDNDTVNIKYHYGNLHILDSANADILVGFSRKGIATIDHASKNNRDGITGFLTRFSSERENDCYNFIVNHNSSVIVTDMYVESQANSLHLTNGPGPFTGTGPDPEGRVSIYSPRTHLDSDNSAVFLDIDNYVGSVILSGQFNNEPMTHTFNHTGSEEVIVTLHGSAFYGSSLITTSGSGVTYDYIGNFGVGGGNAPTDSYVDLDELTLLVDDFQRLGKLDLQLNHSHVSTYW